LDNFTIENDLLVVTFTLEKKKRKHKKCPSCNTKNAGASLFCKKCGLDISRVPIAFTSKQSKALKAFPLTNPLTQNILRYLDYLWSLNPVPKFWLPSGKTSIAKQLFPEAYVRGFEYKSKCVLDDFPEELETSEITRMLCSVGFASPPDWLKSYTCLSQGEKMRVDVARALCLDEPLVVFDEFTSVVDREIAKVSALAITKAVRRSKKKFVAVTCHYDVVD
jgi:ABC-type dipeptide/oligopeptide/nickel transport system ATPase component